MASTSWPREASTVEADWDALDHTYPLSAVGVLSFAIERELAGLAGSLEHHIKVLSERSGNYRWD